MSPEAILLAEQCGGIWKEHDQYPLKDWQYAVANDDTRQSYWDWVLIQLDQGNIFPKPEDSIDDPMQEETDFSLYKGHDVF